MGNRTDAPTATDIEAEDWTAVEQYPSAECECFNGHTFYAKAKFSGRLIALVSKTPCPQCGSYELRRVSDASESQTISKQDVGNIK